MQVLIHCRRGGGAALRSYLNGERVWAFEDGCGEGIGGSGAFLRLHWDRKWRRSLEGPAPPWPEQLWGSAEEDGGLAWVPSSLRGSCLGTPRENRISLSGPEGALAMIITPQGNRRGQPVAHSGCSWLGSAQTGELQAWDLE